VAAVAQGLGQGRPRIAAPAEGADRLLPEQQHALRPQGHRQGGPAPALQEGQGGGQHRTRIRAPLGLTGGLEALDRHPVVLEIGVVRVQVEGLAAEGLELGQEGEGQALAVLLQQGQSTPGQQVGVADGLVAGFGLQEALDHRHGLLEPGLGQRAVPGPEGLPAQAGEAQGLQAGRLPGAGQEAEAGLAVGLAVVAALERGQGGQEVVGLGAAFPVDQGLDLRGRSVWPGAAVGQAGGEAGLVLGPALQPHQGPGLEAGQPGTLAAQLPGQVQILPGAGEVPQQKPDLAHGPVAGGLGIRALGRQFGLQPGQAEPQIRIGRAQIVRRLHSFQAELAFQGLDGVAVDLLPVRAPPEGRGVPALGQGGARQEHGGGQDQGQGPRPGPALPQAPQASGGMGQDRQAGPEPGQVVRQGRRGRIAQRRIGLQALAQDPAQGGRDRPSGRRGAGRGGAMPARGSPVGEVQAAPQGEPQGAAQGEHVRGRAQGGALAQALFGRHVGGGAVDPLGSGEGGVLRRDGQPEVAHIGGPCPVRAALQQDVGRLQVPVDEAQAVGGVDRAGHLDQDLDACVHAQVAGGVGQGRAAHQLHGDPGRPLGAFHVIDLADVRVVHPALGLGFAQEPDHAVRVHAAQDLQGDGALQYRIPGLPDFAHAALAQERAQHIASGPGGGRIEPGGAQGGSVGGHGGPGAGVEAL
jgi:hypothetical protein